ncbi:hypothetical protein AW736_26365 [Termitidicoccus mucosus]|uniref:Uncharacterized protein n=1 Tax=Termitidicoccus mucosus TaxID=1184151 RepID=A0A178IQX7_9BACT|nr:hypothetical protein AW736_26365 [Opitutaceae bacterium TSB47]
MNPNPPPAAPASSRLSAKFSLKPSTPAATPAPASANESPKELCFRIDTDNRYSAEFQLASGETISLPYHHFSFAFGSADGQTLKIKFWSHLVTITGRNLATVKNAIRCAHNVTVIEVEEHFQSLYTGNDVFISRIQIEETKQDQNAQEKASTEEAAPDADDFDDGSEG